MNSNRYFLLTFSFILVLAFSCSKGRKNNIDGTSKHTINLDLCEGRHYTPISTFCSSVKPILLETTDESSIGEIDKIHFYNNLIIIMDKSFANSIFIFDNDGHFIRKIGQVGNGPGEFASLADFTINRDGGYIYVLDNGTNKILAYDIKSGEYINSIEIESTGETGSYSICYYNKKMFADIHNYDEDKPSFLLKEINLENGRIVANYLDAEEYNKVNDRFFLSKKPFIDNNAEEAPLFRQKNMQMFFSLREDSISNYLELLSNSFYNRKELMELKSIPFSQREMQSMMSDKISLVDLYLEFNNYIYFSYLRKGILEGILYDKESKDAVATYIHDDLLFNTKDVSFFPKFIFNDEKYIYGIIDVSYIPQFIDDMLLGKLNDSVDNISELKKLNEEDNPIILYYEKK